MRFYELARIERMLFLVMGYVGGGTLRGHMFDIQGSLPLGEVLGDIQLLCLHILLFVIRQLFLHIESTHLYLCMPIPGRIVWFVLLMWALM